MATRKKTPPPLTKQQTISSDTSDGRAKLALMPECTGALVINAMCKSLGPQSIHELMDQLQKDNEAIQSGNLGGAEAMLMSQAASLNVIFTELSRRAAMNMGEYMQAMESYMRLALKAQAQCTRTLEVLAAIKNPPVVFAKQANIAHGHQQVNNAPARVENLKGENELLGDHHAAMDSRATAAASLINPELETVAALNGREND